MSISVFGLGAVGLPLALVLSMRGRKVFGVDIDPSRIERVKRGDTGLFEFFEERSIDELVLDEISRKRFIPTIDYKLALEESDVIIITIPLPLTKKKRVNFKYLRKGGEMIGKNLKRGDLVILRSTVPIGTTRNILLPILEKFSGLSVEKDFYLSYVPERMAEGKAFEELVNMTTVISGIGERSILKTKEFFSDFSEDLFIAPGVEYAEASKLIENAQRDLNIAMVNELALFLIEKDLSPREVIEVARTHKRVRGLLSPGPGVGGHCLPYAYYYLRESVEGKEFLSLFEHGRKINDLMPERILSLIKRKLKERKKRFKESKVSVLGLSMKNYSKDIRESPSIKFINVSKKVFKEVLSFDPEVHEDISGKVNSLSKALSGSDVVVIMAIQREFERLTLKEIKNYVGKSFILVDTRGLFKREEIEKEVIDFILI